MSDEDVRIEPWTPADLVVELRSNAADMTGFLGGPQDESVVRARHERFLRGREDGTVSAFTLWSSAEPEPVGSVGYWQTEHAQRPVYECGWFVFPAFQRRGLARRGVRRLLEHAAAHGDRDEVWAFPPVANLASNALAAAEGFQNRGVEDFEYPKGVPIQVNAWMFDLRVLRAEGQTAPTLKSRPNP